MNAILCEVDSQPINVVLGQTAFFTRTGARSAEQRRCPHCDSIIYSRRHRLCGVCSQELPEACLFNPHQAQQVSTLIKEEKHRHRLWMTR